MIAILVLVILIGVVLILWGLANVFFGYRFYRVTLLVVFGILGASLVLFTSENLLTICRY